MTMKQRDEFPSAVIEAAAKRSGQRCANCQRSTSGPHSDPTKFVIVGVAAHITAAAPRGPRYDESLSPKERCSIENCIWLCQNCAKLVDSDSPRYTTAMLHGWKARHEAWLERQIAAPHDGVFGIAAMRRFLDDGECRGVFVGSFETLADSYIEPWPVFERLRLDRFTGRDWLIAEVDSFLHDHDRGCFVLEAEAGLGKSAFLAHLVQERGWIHHFVERAPGQDGLGPGLRSLAAQIALAWRIEPYASKWLLPAAASRPDFLETLLVDAAKRRDEVSPGEKIVVAVDALDESAAFPKQNVLGLPKMLPEGVYLVVTQRPVEVTLNVDPPPRVFRLRPADLKNLEDMRELLERTVALVAVANLLAESGIAPGDFVTALLERSGGVWIYLHYVLAEIERGERRPLALEKLPRGLWQYYAEYWSRHRAGLDWDLLELPLLATLAAIQEELPAHVLCAFAGVSETPHIGRLLGEVWRPYLAVSDAGERRYRCYHASLREFLDGSADRSALTSSQQVLADELAMGTRAAHGRIADRALAIWGGLGGGLEGLRDPAQRALDGGYSMRHLVAHLEGAGRLADLERLLRLSWERDNRLENVWYAVHEEERDLSGYLNDVVRVYRAASRSSRQAIQRQELALSILLELHCAYWIGSVRSLASQVPPALLAALVDKGIWRKEHALAYAHQIPEGQQRFLAMVHLLPLLPEPARSEALSEAVTAAQGLRYRSRAETFAVLPLNLPRELLKELLRQELACSTREQTVSFPALAPRLPKDLLSDALPALYKAEPSSAKAQLLGTLAPLMPPGEREEMVRVVVEIAERGFAQERIAILLSVAPFLPRAQRESIALNALACARSDDNLSSRALLLARALPTLQGKEQEAAAGTALKVALDLDEYESRSILRELIPHLPGTVLGVAEKRVLGSAKFRWHLEEYLPAFLPYLAEHPERVGAVFSQIKKALYGGKAVAILAPVLPESLLELALGYALKARDYEGRAEALDRLASRLSRPQLERVLASIHEDWRFGNLEVYAMTRAALILRLSTLGKAEESLSEIHRLGRIGGQTLAGILRFLSPEALPRALAIAMKLPEPECRAAALIGFASLSAGKERKRLLNKAGRLTKRISFFGRDRRVELLHATALLLCEPDRQQALRKALAELRSQAGRFISSKCSEMILSLVPSLSESLLREALRLVEVLEREADAQPIFRAAISILPETLAVEALLLSSGRWFRQGAFPLSPPKYPPSWAARFCGELWSLVPELLAPATAAVVRGLASCLPSRALRAGLLLANAVDKEACTTEVWPDALAAARRIPSPLGRATALIKLVSEANHSIAYWALAAALSIPDSPVRADTLEMLAPHLNSYLEARLRRVAACLRQPTLREPDATQALEILHETGSTSAVRELLNRSPENEREPLAQQAQEIANRLNERKLKAWALLDLVPYLPVSEAAELVGKSISENSWPSEAAPLVVSRWVGRQSPLPEPVARALMKVPSEDLSSLIEVAAPHLPLEVLPEALKAVWRIADIEHRNRALEALAPPLAALPALDLHPLWQDTLARAAGGGSGVVLAVLGAFLPVVEKLGGQEALEMLVGWTPRYSS